MHKHLVYGFIVCFIPISLAGCIVGYKSFSEDEMQPVPPAASLENIKLTCTSDDKPRICDSIQYILRTKYHILDVQTIGQAKRTEPGSGFIIRMKSPI